MLDFVLTSGITDSAFYASQGLFLVWNSVNDPLFGWWSDTARTTRGSQRRVWAILYGGPALAAAFLMPWFLLSGSQTGQPSTVPPNDPIWTAFVFSASLCAYDTFLTLVEVNHQALLADLAATTPERTLLNSTASVLSALGAGSAFLAQRSRGPEQGGPSAFLAVCVGAALAAVGAFIASGLLARKWNLQRRYTGSGGSSEAHLDTAAAPTPSLGLTARNLLQSRNFGLFTIYSFLQVFECTFEKGFLPVTTAVLAPAMSPGTLSILVALSFVVPHVLVVLLTPLVNERGLHASLRSLLLAKLALSLTACFLGLEASPTWLVAYVFTSRVLTECGCRLSPLVVSDLIDEDMVIHKRSQSMGAFLFGVINFFSKPGVSIAPALGWYVLSAYGYRDTRLLGSGTTPELAAATFALAVWIPFLVVAMQLVLWSAYTLHGSRLAGIKQRITDGGDELRA
eukprot:TRINITY_DN2230_c0_g1_i4.p1 TRINITY_DN2230_c0_g1~~TRINITY_DN2230_c0_g1_i4.p1  ORF type:complete len:485 (-),score=101.12 TRINITY_DN2230_c0_g1_i4:8-1372(-)